MPVALLDPVLDSDKDPEPDEPGAPTTRISSRQQKIILALANDTCLYPGCNEFLFDAILVVGNPPYYEWKSIGEFAHVRSPRPGGPRYDPDYPKELLNTWHNAFAACLRHHTVCDHFTDPFATEVLQAWIDESADFALTHRVSATDIKKTLLTRRFIWANRQLRQQLKPAV